MKHCNQIWKTENQAVKFKCEQGRGNNDKKDKLKKTEMSWTNETLLVDNKRKKEIFFKSFLFSDTKRNNWKQEKKLNNENEKTIEKKKRTISVSSSNHTN